MLAPERRDVNSRILHIIPNEIYFEIFGHIATPTENLTEEQIRTFSRLSRVCRLFAGFCLPRTFEHVEFSGSIFRNDSPVAVYNDTIPYRTSRETTLCAQLAEKQPLALALAEKVKVCHFTNWKLDDNGSWAVRLFAKKYITAMVHMKHIRRLEFWNSYVDAEHWTAIAILKVLEDLLFDQCHFLSGPADDEPENRIQLKVSCLQVTECDGHRQPFAAVNVRHLRTLVVDFPALDYVDWFSQSTLTEIRICPGPLSYVADGSHIKRVHDMLMEAPKSVEALRLPLGIGASSPRGILKSMFNDPEGRVPPLLRSLTLSVNFHLPSIFHVSGIYSLNAW